MSPPRRGNIGSNNCFWWNKVHCERGKGLAEFDLIAEKEAPAKWILPCLFRSHYIKGDFLLPIQCSPRRRRRDNYLSRPLPFSVVAPSRQIKRTFRAPAKQASKALSGNNFKKTCSDSQWGKTELNGTSLHLFYGFTLWSLFCFVFRVTCGGIRMVPLVFKANLALVPTQAELPRSCSSSCMLLEFLSTQGDLLFMNAFVETNKFPFQNNHVIWDSFYKLKEQLVEEKVNRSPSLTSSVRCGFRPVVSFQLRGWVWWSDSFSFEKKAFQTGQLHIAVMDTRVNISASVFGTFTCGFYYLKSTRPI